MTALPVLVPLPLPGPLTYEAAEPLVPGSFVVVRVSGKETIGVVWDGAAEHKGTLKPIERVLDLPPMSEGMRRFIERAAKYTLNPPGMFLRLATRAPGLIEPPATRTVLVPTGLVPEPLTEPRQRVLAAATQPATAAELAREAGVSAGVIKGLVDLGALEQRVAPRDADPPSLDPGYRVRLLNPEQEEAAQAIRDGLGKPYRTILLEGVTGSGKTETYLEAVAETVKQGRQALILLPEIALTADFIARVTARFGAPPVAWHSNLTPAERRRAWHAAVSGKARVVAGARSALFLPFADLALTVVDEEHDQSYKQEDQTLYQARDLAVLRAACEDRLCVLASATPSLESWVNVDRGRYEHVMLRERHGPAIMPFLSVVDLRADPPQKGGWIAPAVADAVRDVLSRGEQALLFLNRRGYAPLTMCRSCGWRGGCPNCSTWLVEHRKLNVLLCHQCGHREPVPIACPDCDKVEHIAAVGPGIERIAEEAAELFPLARIEALSSDLVPDPVMLQARLNAVAKGEADLILGTQIVAKGHNFPNLTLVAALDADLGLMGGDLRASERTFQLLNQVAGRAGRAERPGRAMLQTAYPEHPVLKAILSGESLRFREQLAKERRDARMPPYARLVGVIVQGEDEEPVWNVARALAQASAVLTDAGADVFGPAPAPYALLRGKHRVRLLVRMPRTADHASLLPAWRSAVKVPSKIRIVFDVDPYSFM